MTLDEVIDLFLIGRSLVEPLQGFLRFAEAELYRQARLEAFPLRLGEEEPRRVPGSGWKKILILLRPARRRAIPVGFPFVRSGAAA